jgi:hypothetical protein
MREELQTARDFWGKSVYAIYDGAAIQGLGALLKNGGSLIPPYRRARSF